MKYTDEQKKYLRNKEMPGVHTRDEVQILLQKIIDNHYPDPNIEQYEIYESKLNHE